jgi:hypothetical protein
MHLKVEEIPMTDATANLSNQLDEAAGKGAVEDDSIEGGQGGSLSGQLGHRDQRSLLKDNDTDFPEPDAEAEHSGSTKG